MRAKEYIFGFSQVDTTPDANRAVSHEVSGNYYAINFHFKINYDK